MHIAPHQQPTLESLRRLAVAVPATVRTLLAFAQAADWNGRTLTMLLLSTLVCKMFNGNLESCGVTILGPVLRKIESIFANGPRRIELLGGLRFSLLVERNFASCRSQDEACDTSEAVLMEHPVA